MSFSFNFKFIRLVVAIISLTPDCHNKSFGKTSVHWDNWLCFSLGRKEHFLSVYTELREKKEREKNKSW